MGEKAQTKITNEEYERAFHEAAIFLFEQYKKLKQQEEMKQEDVT
jgi:hypothetical protein